MQFLASDDNFSLLLYLIKAEKSKGGKKGKLAKSGGKVRARHCRICASVDGNRKYRIMQQLSLKSFRRD